MTRRFEDEVEYYYYDSHCTKRDLNMGQPPVHSQLVSYLWGVLKCLFWGRSCAIYSNFNFYHTSSPFEYPLEPDLAVIKGIDSHENRSWKVGTSGPAPQVVFEIASDATLREDVEAKPLRYARIGVQEYYVYDPEAFCEYPDEPRIRRTTSQVLFGWQLDQGVQLNLYC